MADSRLLEWNQFLCSLSLPTTLVLKKREICLDLVTKMAVVDATNDIIIYMLNITL